MSKLEEALIAAMKALDGQVAREIQRTPEQREEHGVRKWEPHQKRVELVTSFLMNSLGEQEVGLDSLIILARSFSKALQFVVEDLGEDGLGKVRTEYCMGAFEEIARSCRNGLEAFDQSRAAN